MAHNIEMTERDFLMYVFDPVKFQTFQRAARHAKAAKCAASNNNNISNVDAAAMLDGVGHVAISFPPSSVTSFRVPSGRSLRTCYACLECP